MREESHLDEMRSAIRGDFERLAERRGEQELMRVPEEPPEPDSEEPVAEAPAADQVHEVAGEPEPEPEPAAPTEPGVEPDGPPEAEDEPRRSWLARLFSPP